MKGTVKWFSNPRGYGFLTVDGMDEDIFVHFKNIDMEGYKTLRTGEVVEFELENSERGKPIAIKVKSLKEN